MCYWTKKTNEDGTLNVKCRQCGDFMEISDEEELILWENTPEDTE